MHHMTSGPNLTTGVLSICDGPTMEIYEAAVATYAHNLINGPSGP